MEISRLAACPGGCISPHLLTCDEFREQCLERVTDGNVVEFFHDRYGRWGREAPLMRESTLNKIGAFSLNPRLTWMPGQKANHLDSRAIMDEGKILLLDLGHSDRETNRLTRRPVVTGWELAMRWRRNWKLSNLTIDEFAGYVANEGAVKTLAHVFSKGRKFRKTMTVAHQDLVPSPPGGVVMLFPTSTLPAAPAHWRSPVRRPSVPGHAPPRPHLHP